MRIDGATGAPLDAGAFAVSNTPPSERQYPWTGTVTHDGTDYIASLQTVSVHDSPFDDGSYVFFNKFGSTGPAQATEHTGFLVDDAGRASWSRIAMTATGPVVLWEDGRNDPLEEPYPHPIFSEHMLQRLAVHEPGPEYPVVEIGSIGSQSLDEREIVRFRVAAAGLNPATAVYSAADLPAGAVFDSHTRLFQWQSHGRSASGSAPAITFSADDGTDSVQETVVFFVDESIATLTGLVRRSNGTPVAGVTLEIKGGPDRRLYVGTGADGRYHVEGVQGGRSLRLRPSKLARKQFKFEPASIEALPGSGDFDVADFVATPK
jgi:hypothetical protein